MLNEVCVNSKNEIYETDIIFYDFYCCGSAVAAAVSAVLEGEKSEVCFLFYRGRYGCKPGKRYGNVPGGERRQNRSETVEFYAISCGELCHYLFKI